MDNPAWAPSPVSVSERETILLVEDDDWVRPALRAILERLGYHVLDARNGEDAIKCYGQFTGGIRVLITDMVMPCMTGQELARRLSGRYPGMKVLYISGYTPLETEFFEGFDPGMPFLQKPFLPGVLARKIRELLGESSGPN
jgi:two-component system cell cycle sensor histidine kinase/response regulator CckA